MSHSFLNGAGRGRRAAVIITVAVSALALIATVAALVLAGRDDSADTASTTPKPNASVNVPAGPLTQIKGTTTVDGVSVGYPHSAAGAVSAASEYMQQMGSTLDLERMAKLAKIITDASYADAEAHFVESRKSSRRQLGIAEEGKVPAGVSMTVGPAAYQLRGVTDNQMTVLLLSYYTTIDGQGTLASRVIIMPVDVHWDGSDWKLLRSGPTSDSGYASLVAQPGTADAAAKGWQVIQS